MRSTVVGSVLLIALILAASIWALTLFRGVGLMSPEEALPPEARLVVRVPDVPKLVRRFSRAGSGSDSVEEEWNFMADLLERLLLAHGVRISPASADIERLMTGEAIAALVPDGTSRDALVLILEVGHGSEETIELVRRHLEETPAAAGGLWSLRRHRGLEYATWRPAGGGLLCVTGLRGLSIMATSVESMQKILDTLDGDRPSLVSDPLYRDIRSRIEGGSPLMLYASERQLRASLDAMLSLPGEGSARSLAHLLGLDAMKAAGLSVDVSEGLFMERLFIAMEAEGRGFLGELFADSPRRPQLSPLVPSELPYSMTLSLTSLDAVTRELPAIVGGSSRDERRAVRDRISGLEDFLALNLARDVFATLGDNLVISWGPPAPTGFPRGDRSLKEVLLQSRAVASIPVRDKRGLRKLLDRVDGLARAMAVHEVVEMDGRPTTTYRFESLEPMAPAYTLTNDRLIAATSPELLGKAITAASRNESIADQKDARRLLRSLPEKVHLLFIGDTQRLVDWVGAERGPLPSMIPHGFRVGMGVQGERGDARRTALACRLGRAGLLVESVAPFSPFLMALATLDRPRERVGDPAANE